MSKHNLSDFLIAGLAALGKSKGNPVKQGKFWKIERFQIAGVDEETVIAHKFWFVGPNGALRCGRAVSSSYSLTEIQLYKDILAAGRTKLDPKHAIEEAKATIDLKFLGL